MAELARRERIAVAMQAALAIAFPDLTIERNRRSPVSADEAPAVVLYDLVGHEASLIDMGSVDYSMPVEIEGTVTSTEAGLATNLNALYVQIIRAFADPSLGGLCINLTETALDVHIAPEAESTSPLATFTLRISVQFQTPDGDPTG